MNYFLESNISIGPEKVVYVGNFKNPYKRLCLQQSIPSGVELKKLNSVQELFPMLSDSSCGMDLIIIRQELIFNNSVDAFEILSTLASLIRCTVYRGRTAGPPQARRTALSVTVDNCMDRALIKQLLKSEIRGFYPVGDEFTITDTKAAISELLSGGFHIPEKIKKTLRTPKKIESRKPSAENEIALTPRQRQVFDLVVNRGASNKSIGKILHIAESTVKLHMGAIMKKYGARSRTQLAVFAKH